MLSLAERVDRTILRHSLLPPGARVMVALSGGADSTALACLLVELAARHGFLVAAAAHFNHGLRPSAVEDEAFCRELVARIGIGWARGDGDVRTFAASCGASLEDASRRLRYDFLVRAAAAAGASHVAVGHTRDDQAETVLLQMIRGAGPRGLGGMRAIRRLRSSDGQGDDGVSLVRPLLEVGHEDLVAWLGERGQRFREDESNRDLRFLRNRVRHELMPFLRSRLAPSITSVLARNAEISASDGGFLDELAAQAFASTAVVTERGVEIDADALASQPDPVRRRIVLTALRNLGGGRFVGSDQVVRVMALTEGRLRGPVALPGACVRLAAGRLLVEPSAVRRPGAGRVNFSRLPLSIPGEAPVAGGIISSFIRPWPAGAELGPLDLAGLGASQAVVDASMLAGLAVRTRRPGDWLRPLGMGGRRKKLQDYFVDRKVPRAVRDAVPLVVDQDDRIVWVAGHGIDEAFRVREGTHDVVILTMRGDSA